MTDDKRDEGVTSRALIESMCESAIGLNRGWSRVNAEWLRDLALRGLTRSAERGSEHPEGEHPDRLSLRDLTARAKDWDISEGRLHALVERGKWERTPLSLDELVKLAIEPRYTRSHVGESSDMWRLHARSFDAFLNELYAIMVDPCAEGTIKRYDMMQALKDAALRDRESSEKHQSDPKNANLAALVLNLDKHISLHAMFAPEWEAIAAAARCTPSATEATHTALLERIRQFDAAIRRIAGHVGACCGGVDTEGDGLGGHTAAEIIRKMDERVAGILPCKKGDCDEWHRLMREVTANQPGTKE